MKYFFNSSAAISFHFVLSPIVMESLKFQIGDIVSYYRKYDDNYDGIVVGVISDIKEDRVTVINTTLRGYRREIINARFLLMKT